MHRGNRRLRLFNSNQVELLNKHENKKNQIKSNSWPIELLTIISWQHHFISIVDMIIQQQNLT